MNYTEKYSDFGIIYNYPRFLKDNKNNDFLTKYENGADINLLDRWNNLAHNID